MLIVWDSFRNRGGGPWGSGGGVGRVLLNWQNLYNDLLNFSFCEYIFSHPTSICSKLALLPGALLFRVSVSLKKFLLVEITGVYKTLDIPCDCGFYFKKCLYVLVIKKNLFSMTKVICWWSLILSIYRFSIRDCRQITFVTINIFCPLNKNSPTLLFLSDNIKIINIL